MEHLSGNQLIGGLLAILANIRLGREGMTENNALAFKKIRKLHTKNVL